jgi:hypothetical protein
MKIVPNRVFIIQVVFLMQGTAVFAAPDLPTPSNDPGPPGLPLDGAIFLFALFSVCFGIYKLYKIKNIKNASN